MNDALERIIERFSSYEVLNNIIPGAVYTIFTEKLTSFNIQTGNVWSDIILCYFIGLVIGRVGSLVVDRYLKWRKKLHAESHSEYVKAEQKDKLVRELSAINNMYRTFTAVALCLIFTVGFSLFWEEIQGCDCSKPVVIIIGFIILMIVFGKSYIKQTDYVASRVRTINNMSKEKSDSILPNEEE